MYFDIKNSYLGKLFVNANFALYPIDKTIANIGKPNCEYKIIRGYMQ
jgi:hypothetical protein